MGQPRDVPQATTIEQRAKMCCETSQEFDIKIPFVVDEVTKGCGKKEHGNRCGGRNFERAYGLWPLRFYLFDKTGRILLKGMPEGDQMPLDQIDDALKRHFPAHPVAKALQKHSSNSPDFALEL